MTTERPDRGAHEMADSPERDVLRDAVNEGWHGMDDSWHDYDEIFAALAARGWRLVPSAGETCGYPLGHVNVVGHGPGPSPCGLPPGHGVNHAYPWDVRAAQPSAEPGLASPADPAPEALVEARDEAAYWRTQAIEAEGLARALV